MTDFNRRRFSYLPLSIRIETRGEIATPVVLRGTPLPATRSEIFSTAEDDQPSVEVKIMMGESSLSRNNLTLGAFHLKGLPKAKRGDPKITVEFSVDAECGVTARALLNGTQLAAAEEFRAPELSDKFVRDTIARAEASRQADQLELAKVEMKAKAEALLAQAEDLLRKGPNSALSEKVAALGLALSSGTEEEITQRTTELSTLVSLSSSDFSDIFGSFFGPYKAATNTAPATRQATPRAPLRRPSPKTPQSKSGEELAPSRPAHPLGKIFGSGTFTLDPQLCFVLMPFDSKFQPIYEDQIRPTVKHAGLRCERADEIRGIRQITADIWERINRCRFLIAELTDQNPNVFYELGLAHALGKDVILITQSMNFVPFDIKTLRCIVYDPSARGTKKLEDDLAATIDAVIKSS